jgi:alpha-L-fucosidase
MAVAVVGNLVAKETYTADWESLAKHEAAPEWLKDAKLGIYFHWGVYSVPAFNNEWYPHHMREHFDPEEWAELFKKAGARFAGPVAEHHDGFAMWDSKLTPWNAKAMGPKRDILGDLFQSLEKRDMKTIATFHHARNLQRYRDTWDTAKKKGNSHFGYKPGWPTASEDPKLRLLYGNMPEDEWNEKIWLGKLVEVIDSYQPDIIWFDSWMDQVPESYRQRFSAYYLNAAEEWGKEVAIIRKQKDLPLDFSINDHEKSREPRALPELWMTDDTLSTGSWCYTKNLEIKPLHKVVHTLVDTVAKNGVVLLNISPKADGTIPQDQRDSLLGLGKWLETNGEAIYGTRPWINAAEGPTAEPAGGFKDHKKFLTLEYTARDIRYTASKDGKTVYAITLGTPEAGNEIVLKTFADQNVDVHEVALIGGEKVDWKMTTEGLVITAPATGEPNAVVFKVSL